MSLRIGTSVLKLGTSAIALGGSGAPTDRTWQMMFSVKPGYTGEVGTDHMRMLSSLANIRATGNAEKYWGMDLQPRGLKGDGGELNSCPDDTLITNANTGIVLGDARNVTAYYNGKTLVYEMRSGNLGAGNSLRLHNANAFPGASTLVNSSPTGYRTEKVIGDAAFIDNLIPYIDITAENLINAVVPQLYDKTLEADVNDILNNPYKAWQPDWRTRMDNADITRFTDFQAFPNNKVGHILDFGQLTDQSWVQGSPAYCQDGDDEARSATGRHGAPLVACLDLCENGYASGPQSAWVHIPMTLNSPFRMTARSYLYDTASQVESYVDGVLYNRTQGDTVCWMDKRWVEFSSLTVNTPPTRGGLRTTYLTSIGEFDYQPKGGASPYADPGDNGLDAVQKITFAFNQKTNNGVSAPVVAGSATFTVGLRVLDENSNSTTNNTFYARVQGSTLWPDNKAWFTDAAKWQGQAKTFVNELVASGYSTTRPLYVEGGLESWNSAKAWESDQLIAFGVGVAFNSTSSEPINTEDYRVTYGLGNLFNGDEKAWGAGIYLAFFKHYVEQELASRALSYNIRWSLGTQLANTDWTKAHIYGWMYAHEVLFGYSHSNILNVENAKLWIFGTCYTEGGFGTYNDGITGFDKDSPANTDLLLDMFAGTEPGFAADSTGLEDAYVTWITSDTRRDRNNAQVAYETGLHIAICDGLGANFGGFYEGGNHEFDVFIPGAFWNSTRTNSLGERPSKWMIRFFASAKYGGVVRDRYDRLIAVKPDIILCQYGEMGKKTGGEPWGWGRWQEALTGEGQAIMEYGRL